VDLIRAGPGDDVGGGAETVAELGVGVVGEDAKFGHRVHRWFQNEAAVDSIEVVGAVDQEIVGLGALAVDGVSLAGAQRAAGFGQAGCQWNHARLKKAELREIAAVQRQVENFTFGDDGAEAGDRALDELGVGVDFDFFGAGADFEADRDGGGLVDVEGDALLQIGLKSGVLDLHLIVADGKFEQEVGAGTIRSRGAGQAGFALFRADVRGFDDSAAGVGDGAANASRNLL